MSAKYGLAFAVMAVAALAAGIATGSLPALFAASWAALSFGLMAVAFLGAGPRLLGKRPDGRRAAWAWPLFGPYFALNGLAFALARLGDRRPTPNPIAPNLWLGRRPTWREARQGNAHRWVAVLDLAAEFAEVAPLRSVPSYRSLPTLDATAPPPEALADAVRWIARHAAQGPVLVHCALGHGRSATVAVAYLLADGLAPTIERAMAEIREKRPGVGWNPDQRRALLAFDRTRLL